MERGVISARRRRLRGLAVLAATAIVTLIAWAIVRPASRELPSRAGLHRVGSVVRSVAGRPCPRREGPFVAGAWPSACWRPYSSRSPFNRPLPRSPRVLPGSRRIVDRLIGFGGPQSILVGAAGSRYDFGHPTFWSASGDPVFTVHCTERWGRCALEGRRIRVPDEARPEGGSDAHLTVVDQRTGWEYDLWGVSDKPAGGGTLVTRWGGRTRIDGSGLGSAAVAGSFGTLAGIIREPELEGGQIDHALFMVVHCDSGAAVFPAKHDGRSCSQVGEPNADAPAMGQRFQLDMSAREIDALPVPAWKKTILHAMARYGMYVGDTGGSWSLKEEGGTTYTSFGYPDPWVAYAKRAGARLDPRIGEWAFDLAGGVDWRRLRAIDPCEARGSCR